MLVLTGRRGERIVIGDNIELYVIETKSDRVKLGFFAPPDVVIHREEVIEPIVDHEEPLTSVDDKSHFRPEFA